MVNILSFRVVYIFIRTLFFSEKYETLISDSFQTSNSGPVHVVNGVTRELIGN